MPLTVAAFEDEMRDRLGPYFDLMGIVPDASGFTPLLRGRIRSAIVQAGLTMADPLVPSDADLAGVSGLALERLFDLGELRSLEMLWGQWAEWDQSADSTSQSLSQIADRLSARIEALKEKLAEPYVPIDLLTPGPAVVARLTAGHRPLLGITRPGRWLGRWT